MCVVLVVSFSFLVVLLAWNGWKDFAFGTVYGLERTMLRSCVHCNGSSGWSHKFWYSTCV